MPKLLDLGHVDPAEVRHRLFGQPRRDADAQPAGDQLDDGEACRNAGAVKQPGEHFRPVGAAGGLQLAHHLAQRRHMVHPRGGIGGPDQRNGLGEIADIIV